MYIVRLRRGSFSSPNRAGATGTLTLAHKNFYTKYICRKGEYYISFILTEVYSGYAINFIRVSRKLSALHSRPTPQINKTAGSLTRPLMRIAHTELLHAVLCGEYKRHNSSECHIHTSDIDCHEIHSVKLIIIMSYWQDS